MNHKNPLKRFAVGLFVLFGTPLLVWAYPKYRRLKDYLTPTCPVCDDAMRHVDGVGYVCDRPGCAAYGDTAERARSREVES
jgi:hypothetical protein